MIYHLKHWSVFRKLDLIWVKSLMGKRWNCYKVGAVVSLITAMYVLAVLSADCVEATRTNKAYNYIQGPPASDATTQYCSHVSCRDAAAEMEPGFGDQKRTVPTGSNPLHN